MKTVLALSCGAMLLAAAGCTETRVVRSSSLVSQLEQFNKDGWTVTRNDQPQQVERPGNPLNDPNVRLVRGADWSGLQFQTNFQVDDPASRPPAGAAAADQPGPAAGTPGSVSPWGMRPVTPRQ